MRGSSYRRPGSVFAVAPLPTRSAPTTPRPLASVDRPSFPFVHTCGEALFPQRAQQLTACRPHAYPHDHPGWTCSMVIWEQPNRRRRPMCYAVTTTLTKTSGSLTRRYSEGKRKIAKKEKPRSRGVRDCSQHSAPRSIPPFMALRAHRRSAPLRPHVQRTRDDIRTFTDAGRGGDPSQVA